MKIQADPNDFASAAMMRLLAAGLARRGIPVPVRPPSGAHVPRPLKRGVLQAVMAAHGPLAIPRAPEGMARHAPSRYCPIGAGERSG